MDYYPVKKSERQPWLKHFKNEIAMEAANLGLPADEVAALQATIQHVLDLNDEAEAAAASLRKINSTLSAANKATGILLRKYVKRLKTLPLYTETTGKNLGIITNPPASNNMVDYRPDVSALVTGGFVQVRFVKKKVKSVNIYCKMPGDTVFTLLATAVESPYVDMRPPAIPGVVELRQYYIMGVVKNLEVGQRSEIVAVSYGG